MIFTIKIQQTIMLFFGKVKKLKGVGETVTF